MNVQLIASTLLIISQHLNNQQQLPFLLNHMQTICMLAYQYHEIHPVLSHIERKQMVFQNITFNLTFHCALAEAIKHKGSVHFAY